ncbi:MAG: hypothetical protein IJ644_11215 [Oscillospiraceae bacterium]|nr:hypothetical protein [Oscillospiraceae bacterium]
MKTKKKILLPVLGAFLLMLYSFCYGFGYVPYFLTNSQKEEIMQGYLDTHSCGEKWFYTADIVNVSRKITCPDEVLLFVYLHEDTYQIKDGKIWNGSGGEDILLIHAKLTDSSMEYLDYKSPREDQLRKVNRQIEKFTKSS